MDAKPAGSRLALPTRNPSTSGCAISPAAMSGLTLPPYRIRTLFDASGPNAVLA